MENTSTFDKMQRSTTALVTHNRRYAVANLRDWKWFFLILITLFGFSVGVAAQPADPKPFITVWKTDNPGASEDNQITIPTNTFRDAYDYTVDWGDGSSDDHVTGNITHTYTDPGTYTVAISGMFPWIYFNDEGDRQKILDVQQWGDNAWSSMNFAFFFCTNLDVTATDTPDLSKVKDLNRTFAACAALVGTPSFETWEVGGVTDMSEMFDGALEFDQDIGGWDVSNVLFMEGMFQYATKFNQGISSWNVGNVGNMRFMFDHATSFDQDIGSWDVSSVSDMDTMFSNAISFDQDLGNWDVSNVEVMYKMFEGVRLSTTNYDAMLKGWVALSLKVGVPFDGGDSQYCAEAARKSIIDTYPGILEIEVRNLIVLI